ncbi:MAG: RHS repeat protein [Chloroflexi bacterium]|nr:RHS repeat protein [Chloroflexota bacterium]
MGIVKPVAVMLLYDTTSNDIGQRTKMEDGPATTTWGYDGRGRVLTETVRLNNQPYTTSYGYDSLDRVAKMTYPDGEVVTTTYNLQGLPATLTGNLAGQITNTVYLSGSRYNAFGQPSRFDLGNGLSEYFGYFGYGAAGLGMGLDQNGATFNSFAFGRLMQLCVAPSGSADAPCALDVPNPTRPTLLNLSYSYDHVGNINAMREMQDTQVVTQIQFFDYDPLDRLVQSRPDSISGQYVTQTYQYNQIGNITAFG